MKDLDNLCVNCFEELTEGAVCARCGYDNDSAVDFIYLSPKTILLDRYVVGAVQAVESDSVTYAGYDSQLDKKITIREFYPKGMVSRLEGSSEIHVRQKYIEVIELYRKEFFDLWTTLEKLHSLSAATPVYDVFESNSTVYAVIEDMESIPLREYLLRNEDNFVYWDSARLMFMPVLTTIEALHNNGIIHGSITPDSLVLCRDGKVRLKPFCIQECTDKSSPFEFVSSDGYTALEQYENNHKICPATDIYAFSACIYRALVGANPPAATAREANDKLMIPNSIAESIPVHVIRAMGGGLQIYPEKRIRNIADFRELLDAAPSVMAQATGAALVKADDAPRYDYAKLAEPEKNKTSRIIIAILSLLIIVAVAAGIFVAKQKGLLDNGLFGSRENTTESVADAVDSFEVPNFTSDGTTVKDVEENAQWNDHFVIRYKEEFSTDVEEGIIFKQSITAGEMVKKGTEITLTVSLGIQTVEIPDVSGLTLDDAIKQLEDLGLNVSTVEVLNDGSYTPNTVRQSYATAPGEGEIVAVGGDVIVQFYGEVQTTTKAATEDAD